MHEEANLTEEKLMKRSSQLLRNVIPTKSRQRRTLWFSVDSTSWPSMFLGQAARAVLRHTYTEGVGYEGEKKKIALMADSEQYLPPSHKVSV